MFFYFMKPRRAIVALATASADRKSVKNWSWPYCVAFNHVRLIAPEITLEQIRKEFPKWGWAKQTRNQIYLDESKVDRLLKLARVERMAISRLPVIKPAGGAGLGTPEQNRIVEKAARNAFRLHCEKLGYEVVSREKENLGYDFDVIGKGKMLHVELKGTSGTLIRFPITINEFQCAKADAKFRLAVVTEATRESRQVHFFGRNEFLTDFTRTPIAYFAEMKRQGES